MLDGILLGLVRHGQTDWNRQGRIQGQTDIPLNDQGILEARKIAERISAERWDQLYCSDMKRAKDTALAIQRLSPDLIVQADSRLRERYYGLIEGTTITERTQRFGVDWKVRPHEIGMESEFSLRKRCASWFAEMIHRHTGERVLVVTHGGWIRSALLYWFHQIPEGWLGNASLTLIRFEKGNWICELYNDAGHLMLRSKEVKF